MRDGSTVYCDACDQEIDSVDLPITVAVTNAPTSQDLIVRDVVCDFHPDCWLSDDFHLGNMLKNQYEPWLA